MDPIVLLTLIISTALTFWGNLVKSTQQLIHLMSAHAAVIGLVKLTSCLVNLLVGLELEALIDFFATFAEWFSAAAISPMIIYWGMKKTENVSDEQLGGRRRAAAALVITSVLNVILFIIASSYVPEHMSHFPFVALMFSFSILIMVMRRDPLKILIGLNMAENSLYPMFAESPIVLIPFMLVLMVFVNMVGVFIIIEAYKDYRSMNVSDWRLAK
ncbi:MAG: hypothetical protein RMJ07_00750 [Nitrososphaerota archaeon]|nr:hypothetical protein [Candidatus Bathyarchaeota archaeon]MDW8048201.1 hypothetical protein [Nitrososphaerota archaeon]